MADTDKLKVVIADDEPIIVMNLREVLEDGGYSPSLGVNTINI